MSKASHIAAPDGTTAEVKTATIAGLEAAVYALTLTEVGGVDRWRWNLTAADLAAIDAEFGEGALARDSTESVLRARLDIEPEGLRGAIYGVPVYLLPD